MLSQFLKVIVSLGLTHTGSLTTAFQTPSQTLYCLPSSEWFLGFLASPASSCCSLHSPPPTHTRLLPPGSLTCSHSFSHHLPTDDSQIHISDTDPRPYPTCIFPLSLDCVTGSSNSTCLPWSSCLFHIHKSMSTRLPAAQLPKAELLQAFISEVSTLS